MAGMHHTRGLRFGPRMLSVLRLVARQPEPTRITVVRALSMPTRQAYAVVARAVAAGLLAADTSTRPHRLSLTQMGRDALVVSDRRYH